MPESLTFVIKLSKLCNLRCTYCYELSQLSDSRRITGQDLTSTLKFVRDYAARTGAQPRIIWHGGEPLALPMPYWQRVLETVDSVFGMTKRPAMSIQTNLFSLTDARLSLLEQMDYVGVSFDVTPGQRIDRQENLSEHKVLENLDKLRAAGVRFGCIAVLNRQNADGIDAAFDFFNSAGISYRLLPFYRADNPAQEDVYGLSSERIVAVLSHLFNRWLVEGRGIAIEPISTYLTIALNHMLHLRVPRYDKASGERVLLLNTDGTLWSNGNAYRDGWSYGNAFADDPAEVIIGTARGRNVQESAERMRNVCGACPYFGACDGWPIGEATEYESRTTCGVTRPLIDYMVKRMTELDIVPDMPKRVTQTVAQDLAVFA